MAIKKIKSRFFGKIQQEYFEVYPHFNSLNYKRPEIRTSKFTKERFLLSELDTEHIFVTGEEVFIPEVNKNATIEKAVLGIDGSMAYYTTFIKEVLQGEYYKQSKIKAEEKLKGELEKYNAWLENKKTKIQEENIKEELKRGTNKKLYTELKTVGIYSTNESKFMNLLTNSFVELEFEKENSRSGNVKEVGTAKFLIPLRYENLMDKFLIKYKDKTYDFIGKDFDTKPSIVAFYSKLFLVSKEKKIKKPYYLYN